jgi:hypothetical protein
MSMQRLSVWSPCTAMYCVHQSGTVVHVSILFCTLVYSWQLLGTCLTSDHTLNLECYLYPGTRVPGML